jgi:hypothetical protein
MCTAKTYIKKMQQILDNPHHIDRCQDTKVPLRPLINVPQFHRRVQLAVHVLALALRELRKYPQTSQQTKIPSRCVARGAERAASIHRRGRRRRRKGVHVDAPVLVHEREGGGGGMCKLQLVVGDVVERFELIAYALGCHCDLNAVNGLTANHIALLGATKVAERFLVYGRHDM